MICMRELRIRKISPLLSVLLVAVIFVAGYSLTCNKTHASCTQPPAEVIEPVIEIAPRYFTYTPESLAYAQKQGKTVLYFWAPWCTSCTSLDAELKNKVKMIPEGVTVLRLEYNAHKDLEKKYAVTTQHTFVQIDNDNEKQSLWVGGDIENFKKFLR